MITLDDRSYSTERCYGWFVLIRVRKVSGRALLFELTGCLSVPTFEGAIKSAGVLEAKGKGDFLKTVLGFFNVMIRGYIQR